MLGGKSRLKRGERPARRIREIVMITGDNDAVARAVARGLGIDRYFAGVLPEDKAALVEECRATGRTVAMVGDGVNALDAAHGAIRRVRQSFAIVAGLNSVALARAIPPGLVGSGFTAFLSNGSAILASLNAIRPSADSGMIRSRKPFPPLDLVE